MIGGKCPFLRENLADTYPSLQNADFQSIFARNASTSVIVRLLQITQIV